MTFGDLELTPLLDGYLRLDGGAMFGVVPKPLWEKRAPADERNRMLLGMRPVLVRGERLLIIDAGAGFAADLMPTTAHIDEPWIMGYDLYPMETLAFKRHFVREAIEREYLIFFEHDPKIAAGYIRETNGKKHVEAVEEK